MVGGRLTATGKPLLANDPHRPVGLPSLRKTVHLVAPGWNVIGAGEPALPGVAIGHNERIAWGITTIPIDQQDLYVETLNPANPDEYRYRDAWRKFETAHVPIAVKGEGAPRDVVLRFSVHGPVFHLDSARGHAYALRWVGAEPGTAGYLASLSVDRAANWREFEQATRRWRGPGHNIIFADREGNIGWQSTGLIPIRRGWNGQLPVPGDRSYEWDGFVPFERMPRLFNPAPGFIATANHNNMPADFPYPVSYRFTPPFRYGRIVEMLTAGGKFTVPDFERMQQDATSLAARRFLAIVRKWRPAGARESAVRDRMVAWNANLDTGSWEAAVYEAWTQALTARLTPAGMGDVSQLTVIFERLEASAHDADLSAALGEALRDLARRLGPEESGWRWGRLHTIAFRHPLGVREWDRGPVERPGDGFTVNSTGGSNYRQATGASYRHVIDLADWDRSTVTNTPGESGDPASPHYSDLVKPWAAGEYHPLPFTRKAVEAATEERIRLTPGR